MEFQDRLAAYCRERELMKPGDRVICALSGGADSVALLWSLYLLREKWDLRLSAAHFNHGLRGEESDRDEEFVRTLCEKLNIPLTVSRGNVVPAGRGVEDAARRARYAFFETLDPDARIATAHTADDNAETVLLHLLRGTGLRGLGGIAPRRGRIIRPMLTVTRRDVEEFLTQWNLRHVEDSSNAGSDFLRNRLRQQVMPVLCRENPRFTPNCSRTAQGLREDEEFLTTLAQGELEKLRCGGGISCAGLLALHPAMRSRAAAMFLRELGVKEPEQIHITQTLSLAASDNPGAWTRLPGGARLTRKYDILLGDGGRERFSAVALPVPGEIRAGGWLISCAMEKNWEKNQNTPFTFAISCDRISQYPLTVRTRQPEDTIALTGGHRRVKRAMIDKKIPAGERDNLPVIAAGQWVLAVAGLGVNLDFSAKADETALVIRARREETNE